MVLREIQTRKADISLAHVQFLQACIYAKAYAYAESQVKKSWPTPRKGPDSNVELVLRYFYLRGIVHMGTGNWMHATRCFWTCTCIPAESSTTVSAIAIAAWKKMVLVECLQYDFHSPNISLPTESAHTSSGLKSYIEEALSNATMKERADMLSKRSPESTHTAMVDDSVPQRFQDTREYHGIAYYERLVKAFSNIDRGAFDTVARDASRLFNDDGTAGLVRRIDAILLRRQLYRVGSIFCTIQVDHLANELRQTDLHSFLLQISEEKSWPVRVEDNWVYFPPSIPANQPQAVVAETISDIIQLRNHLHKLNTENLSKQQSRKKEGSAQTKHDCRRARSHEI